MIPGQKNFLIYIVRSRKLIRVQDQYPHNGKLAMLKVGLFQASPEVRKSVA